MGILDLITKEQKVKAFEKAKSEADIPEGKLILVTEEYLDAALSFAKDCFTQDEPVIRSLCLQWHPIMVHMWTETVKSHLTLGVLNEDNGKIIALRGVKVSDRTFSVDVSKIDVEGFKIISSMYDFATNQAGLFDRYNVEEAFHFFGLGVDREFRRRGLGGRLFRASMIMLKNLGLDSFCVKGESSSMFSGRVYEKNGFELLYDMPYADYLVDGKQVICNTGEHTHFRVYGIKVHKYVD